jgi:fructose 1,6-bisphosphatase
MTYTANRNRQTKTKRINMETISLIADICGILGFLISIFAVSKVYKIKKEMSDNNKVSVSGKTNIGGDFTGRDKKV